MKGENIQLLDLRKLSSVTDFFVICSSKSVVGVKAISEEVLSQLRKDKVSTRHVEGISDGTWVLVDCYDIVIHIFLEPVREYYDIESLWGDAPRKEFRTKPAKKSPKRKSKK